ncbi:MAG TPA: peptidase C26 [Firmicutes bacterium]|nr:peptidase C26 [Bacillota bacterium]HAW69934.1 peptidase C26 [Bacillota bacterium]HAZ20796.1 peptidase C26 [Bacillota bacterium]HBE05887.1 peptidase C26 [Bacillota bacterium]HBG43489.1 peptidase C26 [Bacillota bacterium]
MKPVIGITPSWELVSGQEKHTLACLYWKAVEMAGGLPVLLPYLNDANLLELIARIDGLLLSGGGDLEPGTFGEQALADDILKGVAPERDRAELNLCKAAAQERMPMLGICRGAQVMNVAFGGTLYQDISVQIKDSEGRKLHTHAQKEPRWQASHTVNIAPETLLAACYRTEKAEVNSFHHQLVKDIAPGFIASAYSDDGLVEAIECPDWPFALGVQWHPECMWERMPSHLGTFVALVKFAAGHRHQ